VYLLYSIIHFHWANSIKGVEIKEAIIIGIAKSMYLKNSNSKYLKNTKIKKTWRKKVKFVIGRYRKNSTADSRQIIQIKAQITMKPYEIKQIAEQRR